MRGRSFLHRRGEFREVVAFPFPLMVVGTVQGGCTSQPSTIFIPPRGRGEGRCSLAPPQGCRGGCRLYRDVVVAARVDSQEASLNRGIKDLPLAWEGLWRAARCSNPVTPSTSLAELTTLNEEKERTRIIHQRPSPLTPPEFEPQTPPECRKEGSLELAP